MPGLNALIPMGINVADWGNALSKGVETGNALAKSRYAAEDQDWQRQGRNALLSAGGQLATGDSPGAASTLFKAGRFADAQGIQSRGNERNAALMGNFGTAIANAKTPEEWDAALNWAARMEGTDPAEVRTRFGGIENRDRLLQAITSAKDQYGLAKTKAETGKLEAETQKTRAETENPALKIGGTVETVRGKLARGEALSPGEQSVYDDAKHMSAFDRMLLGGGEDDSSAPGLAAKDALTPLPKRPMSTGPLPFENDVKRRRIGQVYDLPNGRQGLWSQDDQGKVGWEMLN